MRIKIIGDNNCARASRHLLRLAGFAVTDFMPVEAVTDAPHAGYCITIELAPAPHPLTPASKPDQATHGQPAMPNEEALPLHGGASSPSFVPDSGTTAGRPSCGANAGISEGERSLGHIHFDSVDGALETAILRHVTQLAADPVVVDRPGGVVHSERELRIVVPVSGDAKMDEAAAVAVEFGVLRGLLDITSPGFQNTFTENAAHAKRAESMSSSEVSIVSGGAMGKKKKWWAFGIVLIAHAALTFAGDAQASPRPATAKFTHAIEMRGAEGAYLHLNVALAAAEAQGQFATGQGTKIFDGTNSLVLDPCQAQTKLYVSIIQTANTQLVAGTSSKKIYICSIHVVVAAATNIALVEGTGSVCASGTAGVSGFGGATAATGWNFMANGGIVLGTGQASVGAEGTSADNLCLFNSGSGQVSGGISYVVQ